MMIIFISILKHETKYFCYNAVVGAKERRKVLEMYLDLVWQLCFYRYVLFKWLYLKLMKDEIKQRALKKNFNSI